MFTSYKQYREEGVGRRAIETLMLSHDLLRIEGKSADEVASFLRASHALHPVTVAEVWPTGTPEHWRAVA